MNNIPYIKLTQKIEPNILQDILDIAFNGLDESEKAEVIETLKNNNIDFQ